MVKSIRSIDDCAEGALALLINPGSTSTKIALWDIANEKQFLKHSFEHTREDAFEKYARKPVIDQLDYRKSAIIDYLHSKDIDLSNIDMVCARGGLLEPVDQGGAYAIDETILTHSREAGRGEHASNLGALIANDLKDDFVRDKTLPFLCVVDPLSIDERDEKEIMPTMRLAEGKISYQPWHTLSIQYCAKKYAEDIGKNFDDSNIIVAHLGGGTSIAVFKGGKCVSVTDGLLEGPVTVNRAGKQSTESILSLVDEGYSTKEIRDSISNDGGAKYYWGNSSLDLLMFASEKNGDEKAAQIYNRILGDTAGEIMNKRFSVFEENEKIDGIVLIGGLANSEAFVDDLKARLMVDSHYKFELYPSGFENEALFYGGLNALKGKEGLKNYNEHIKDYSSIINS